MPEVVKSHQRREQRLSLKGEICYNIQYGVTFCVYLFLFHLDRVQFVDCDGRSRHSSALWVRVALGGGMVMTGGTMKRTFCVRSVHFCNWPVFSAYFLSMTLTAWKGNRSP